MNEIITEIEVEVRGTITISLKKEDIRKIVERGGDYEEYINNMRYRHLDVDDIEDEGRTFNADIVRNAITQCIKENPELGENCPIFTTASEDFLSGSRIPREMLSLYTEGISPTNIDRELLKHVYPCADNHNPKHELNYVYFDELHMVATDTRRLIFGPNETGLADVYIPKAFCERYCMDETALLYIKQDDKKNREVFLQCKDGACFHFAAEAPLLTWNFPDYSRIVPNSLRIEMDFEEYQSKLLMGVGSNHLSAVAIGDNEFLFFDNAFILEGVELSFGCNKPELPFMFYSENIIYVVMPVLTDPEDIGIARRRMAEKRLCGAEG